MDKQIRDLGNDLMTLASDARALMAATADVAGQKADEARQRLSTTLAKAKHTSARLRETVLQRRTAMSAGLRASPFQAIGIAFGIGLLLGLLQRPPSAERTPPPES